MQLGCRGRKCYEQTWFSQVSGTWRCGAGLNVPFKRLRARAVAEAKLKIGDTEVKKKTAAGDMSAVFTVSLTKGDKPRLQSWFHDKAGKDLGGSYFVYVTKQQ